MLDDLRQNALHYHREPVPGKVEITATKSLIVPASSHVSRKFGFEHYFSDLDKAMLFTECRLGGFSAQLPATGMATIEFPVMGRDMETYEDGSAPFFVSPAAASTTGLFTAVNGLLVVAGAAVGSRDVRTLLRDDGGCEHEQEDADRP